MIDGANLNTFKCIIEHEFDRLQLSFNTGIIFLFCMCMMRLRYSEAGVCKSVRL